MRSSFDQSRCKNFPGRMFFALECFVMPTLWPDFRKAQFNEALEEYARRHRRFGAV
ncbi:MAG: undecaprenyl diphosphate synthase family protein [Verrucomicrobiota bacterium]